MLYFINYIATLLYMLVDLSEIPLHWIQMKLSCIILSKDQVILINFIVTIHILIPDLQLVRLLASDGSFVNIFTDTTTSQCNNEYCNIVPYGNGFTVHLAIQTMSSQYSRF